MSMIVLDDFGTYLGKKRNRFVVRKGDEKREFQVEKVDSIICTSMGAAFSSGALNLAIKNNIQVVFAHYSGQPYAILMPMSMTGSVRARREQFLAYNDERGLILAKGFVMGKLKNQANILKLMAKNRKARDKVLADRLYHAGRMIDEIYDHVDSLVGCNIDEKRLELMNLEAEAARTYWRSLSLILPEKIGFDGRETRGARDPFNAMLNFGYQALLFPEVWKAVCYAGLDPYAGFLHADRPGKPSLVLDLMEEFRQQIVDRVLITLISKRIIKVDEILAAGEEAAEGRILSKKTVKAIFSNILERFNVQVVFNGRRASIKSFIYSQARMVARFLVGGSSSYIPFVLGW